MAGNYLYISIVSTRGIDEIAERPTPSNMNQKFRSRLQLNGWFPITEHRLAVGEMQPTIKANAARSKTDVLDQSWPSASLTFGISLQVQ
jgi:hypothetical protein